MSCSLHWFRDDLRVTDNPGLRAAAAEGRPVAGLYVLPDPDGGPAEEGRAPGAAACWWLARSLAALADELEALAIPLLVRRGPARAALPALARELGAGRVSWNRVHEPARRARDAELAEILRAAGLEVVERPGEVLAEPGEVRTGQGTIHRVFTPFWKALQTQAPPPEPLPAPAPRRQRPPAAEGLDPAGWAAALGAETTDNADKLAALWQPGAAEAEARLATFLRDALPGYAGNRDRPDLAGTSRLSPHLRFGEISPRQAWHRAAARAGEAEGTGGAGENADLAADAESFRRELGWRDFCVTQLHRAEDLARQPLDPRFAAFPWATDEGGLAAWREGRTGFPFIDAAMRQLAATGWMHNRARMVVGSFLVKDLRLPWQAGERWFWARLVDGDPASNPANWQWVAGCGADAAPYFRIFNPERQSRRFDPEGTFIRRWVPELAALPDRHIHAPHKAAPLELEAAGVALDRDYPAPILDHDAARKAALAAFKELSGD